MAVTNTPAYGTAAILMVTAKLKYYQKFIPLLRHIKLGSFYRCLVFVGWLRSVTGTVELFCVQGDQKI